MVAQVGLNKGGRTAFSTWRQLQRVIWCSHNKDRAITEQSAGKESETPSSEASGSNEYHGKLGVVLRGYTG